jgi:hypothetical protein
MRFVRECLLLSLILTALFGLPSFRLSKQSRELLDA